MKEGMLEFGFEFEFELDFELNFELDLTCSRLSDSGYERRWNRLSWTSS